MEAVDIAKLLATPCDSYGVRVIRIVWFRIELHHGTNAVRQVALSGIITVANDFYQQLATRISLVQGINEREAITRQFCFRESKQFEIRYL